MGGCSANQSSLQMSPANGRCTWLPVTLGSRERSGRFWIRDLSSFRTWDTLANLRLYSCNAEEFNMRFFCYHPYYSLHLTFSKRIIPSPSQINSLQQVKTQRSGYLEAEVSALAFSQQQTSKAQPWDYFALNSKNINAKQGRQSQVTQPQAFLHVTSRTGLFLKLN